MRHRWRFAPAPALAAALLVPAAASAAPRLADLVPAAPHCQLAAAPPDAGLAVTPGGFVLVHPRNAALPANYSGCKSLWVDAEPGRYARFATLVFERGRLIRAIAHDPRAGGAIVGACAYPGGTSLMPGDDPRAPARACDGADREPFYGLRLATWPRRCAADPDAAICRGDPE